MDNLFFLNETDQDNLKVNVKFQDMTDAIGIGPDSGIILDDTLQMCLRSKLLQREPSEESIDSVFYETSDTIKFKGFFYFHVATYYSSNVYNGYCEYRVNAKDIPHLFNTNPQYGYTVLIDDSVTVADDEYAYIFKANKYYMYLNIYTGSGDSTLEILGDSINATYLDEYQNSLVLFLDKTERNVKATFSSDPIGLERITEINEGDSFYLVVNAEGFEDNTEFTLEYSTGEGFVSEDDFEESISNDFLAGALLLTGSSGTHYDNNVNATREPTEINIISNQQHSLWFKWVAPSSNMATFDTIGSDFDTVIGVYTNSSSPPTFGSMYTIATDDDGYNSQSRVTIYPTQGTTYYIGVAGYSSNSGNIKLNWNS